MKILNVLEPKGAVQLARELFFATWHVATRTVVREGPASVSWIVYADLEGDGKIPSRIVAGGVVDSRGALPGADLRTVADARIARRFNLWTIAGPAGMVGRAGW